MWEKLRGPAAGPPVLFRPLGYTAQTFGVQFPSARRDRRRLLFFGTRQPGTAAAGAGGLGWGPLRTHFVPDVPGAAVSACGLRMTWLRAGEFGEVTCGRCRRLLADTHTDVAESGAAAPRVAAAR